MTCLQFSLLLCISWIFAVFYWFCRIFIGSGEQKDARMTSSVPEVMADDEEPGDFLLTTERLFDCFFVVGSADQGPVERIGAVKACLMNQSRVFRNMLHDSHLAETGDIPIPDIQPPTFRLLLRHCYGGLENCRSLDVEATLRLCYAAEKYLIASLKKKIADRLKPDSATDVFPALHCLVTFNVTDLETHVTELVREQTDKIFAQEGFLDMDVDSLVFILKQETLNCPEVDIWRAALKWAKHKAQAEEGRSLREWLSQPLKHLRLSTLSCEHLCQEVLPAGVLSFEEFSRAAGVAEPGAGAVCTLREPRPVYQERWKWWETVSVNHERQEKRWAQSDLSYSCLAVGDRSIMLESLTCLGAVSRDFHDSYGLGYPVQADLVISRVSDYISGSCAEPPVTVRFSGNANYYEQFTIPTLVGGESVTLQANSLYKLRLSLNAVHPCWLAPTCSEGHVFSHGKFYCAYTYEEGVGWKPSHVVKFQYSYRR